MHNLSNHFFLLFQVQWPVSHSAKHGSVPPLIESLARPKERKDGAYRDPEWRVAKSARNAQASTRVQVSKTYYNLMLILVAYCHSIYCNYIVYKLNYISSNTYFTRISW